MSQPCQSSSKYDMKKHRQHGNRHQWGGNRAALIEFGVCGFFVTVEGLMQEKPAVREFYNLFDLCYVPDTTENTSNKTIDCKTSNIDASDELTAACVETSKQDNLQSGQYSRLYLRQVPTNVKNCLFFQCNLPTDKIYLIADSIVDKCQTKNCCRFVARCIPVEMCTGSELTHFSKDLERLIHYHFVENCNDDKPPSYALEFKARNCNALDRKDVLMLLDQYLTILSPMSRVNLNTPTLSILVNILQKNVLLSCVRRYQERRRFSTRPPKEETKETDKSVVDGTSKDASISAS